MEPSRSPGHASCEKSTHGLYECPQTRTCPGRWRRRAVRTPGNPGQPLQHGAPRADAADDSKVPGHGPGMSSEVAEKRVGVQDLLRVECAFDRAERAQFRFVAC